MSLWTFSTLPAATAYMSAVHPSSSCAFKLHFFSMMYANTSAYPCAAALIAAVPPSALGKSNSDGPRCIALSTST